MFFGESDEEGEEEGVLDEDVEELSIDESEEYFDEMDDAEEGEEEEGA